MSKDENEQLREELIIKILDELCEELDFDNMSDEEIDELLVDRFCERAGDLGLFNISSEKFEQLYKNALKKITGQDENLDSDDDDESDDLINMSKEEADDLIAKIDEMFRNLGPDDDDDSDDLDNIIYLNDEEGNEVAFEFLDLIEYEGQEYVVLLPGEDSDDDDSVIILKVEESDDGEEEAYISVEDEDTLKAVFNIFKENFKDAFDFTD